MQEDRVWITWLTAGVIMTEKEDYSVNGSKFPYCAASSSWRGFRPNLIANEWSTSVSRAIINEHNIAFRWLSQPVGVTGSPTNRI